MIKENERLLEFFQKQSHSILKKSFDKTEVIIRQGAHLNHVYCIISGIVKCYYTDINDKEFIVEFLGKGEILGEVEAIQRGQVLCSIQALTPLETFMVPIDHFRMWLEKDLELNQLLLDSCTKRIVDTAKRASIQQLNDIEFNLKQLKDWKNLPISKTDLAAYLGVTVRALNRTLKNYS